MIDPELRRQLLEHEGLRLRVYDDATGRTIEPDTICQGKPTIGVGRNLLDRGISEAEAMAMLERDVKECEDDLRGLFGNWHSITETRRRALLNMRFNLGPVGFRGFRNMVAAVQAGRWADAAGEAMASKWAGQVGRRAREIADALAKG